MKLSVHALALGFVTLTTIARASTCAGPDEQAPILSAMKSSSIEVVASREAGVDHEWIGRHAEATVRISITCGGVPPDRITGMIVDFDGGRLEPVQIEATVRIAMSAFRHNPTNRADLKKMRTLITSCAKHPDADDDFKALGLVVACFGTVGKTDDHHVWFHVVRDNAYGR
ncbi:hypothetical protein [Labrys monachus]|uniref:Uncharacterized protein n=1 Tax=Labrys monachus TaxID=217067 RepID=A0ABU0F763_9HYPH|nr:hypothetical protein [Labrys monachus]MDQ0390410.1 hypothetical protein [Labrys monachus]